MKKIASILLLSVLATGCAGYEVLVDNSSIIKFKTNTPECTHCDHAKAQVIATMDGEVSVLCFSCGKTWPASGKTW